MSKEFYHAMLEMDKYIQKSLETKYNHFSIVENDKYKGVQRQYIFPVTLPKELLNGLIECGIVNLDRYKEMTDKEIFTVKVLDTTITKLTVYLAWFNDKEDSLIVEEVKKDLEENYRQFRALLELQ